MSDGSHREGPASIAAALGGDSGKYLHTNLSPTPYVKAVLGTLMGIADAAFALGTDPLSEYRARVSARRWASFPTDLMHLTLACKEPYPDPESGALGAMDRLLMAAMMLHTHHYNAGREHPDPYPYGSQWGQIAFDAVEELVKRHGGLK